jgi:hypothetical protein
MIDLNFLDDPLEEDVIEDKIDAGPSLEQQDLIDENIQDANEGGNGSGGLDLSFLDEPISTPEAAPLPKGQLTQTQPPAPLPSATERGLDFITGADRLTEETRNRPELIDLLVSTKFGKTTGPIDKTVDIDLGSMITEEASQRLAKALAFSSSEQDIVDVMEDVFPASDIRKDEQGTVIMTLDGNKTILLNRPGVSRQDAQRNIFDLFMSVSGNALVGAYKSAVKRMGASFAFETGLDATKQLLSGNEDVDIGQAITTGVLGTAPDLIAIRKARKLNKKRGLQFHEDSFWKRVKGAVKGEGNPFVVKPTPAAMEAQASIIKAQKFEEIIGKEIFNPIQRMLDPEDIATVSGVTRQFPKEVSEKVKQNFLKDVPETAEEFLRAFSDIEQRTRAPGLVRTAVENHRKGFQSSMRDLSGQIYLKVRNDKTHISLTPAVQNLFQTLQESGVAKGSPVWNAVAKNIGTAYTGAKTVGQVHNSKVAMGKIIGRLDPNISVDRHIKSILTEFNNHVTNILSVKSEPYRLATEEFLKRVVPAREAYEGGLTAALASMPFKKKSDIVDKMFKDGIKKPGELLKTKKVLDAIDPELFNNALGTWVDNRVKKINIPELISDDIKDIAKIPTKFKKALFGTDTEKTAMKRVLGPKQKEAFALFEDAINRLEKGWGKNIAGDISSGFAEREASKSEKTGLLKKIFTAVATPAAVSTVSPQLGMASAIGTSSRVTKDILAAQRTKSAIKRINTFKKMMFDPKNIKELQNIKRADLSSETGLRIFFRFIRAIEDESDINSHAPNFGGH